MKATVIDEPKLSPVNKSNPVPHQNAQRYAQLPTDKLIEDTSCTTLPRDEKSNRHATKSNSTESETERKVIRKMNAAEELHECAKDYENNSTHELNMSFQAAFTDFDQMGGGTPNKDAKSPQNVVNVKGEVKKPSKHTGTAQYCSSNLSPLEKQLFKSDESETNGPASACQTAKNANDNENKVVLRQKKVGETESQRRQRLSVHMEEIMKGNVKAAMEIFESMRKREELKGILSQVQEIEGQNRNAEVSSFKTFCNNVPGRTVASSDDSKQSKVETQDDDLESVSSVETTFEDLEKASKEIINLKEQTLAKLLDIEEAIKKALYSVSNLKSEADIAGLSGLFDESLKSEQHVQPASNIRKISIVSSKAKSGQGNTRTRTHPSDSSLPTQEAAGRANNKVLSQSYSQSSPSFISIHSAARKPVEPPLKATMSTFKPAAERNGHEGPAQGSIHSPAERKVSVLEVQTAPEEPAGIFGTKTVSETYKETDGFGNVFVSSVTSTFVTKQSTDESAAVFEVGGAPNAFEVVTSPLLQTSRRPSEDQAPSHTNEKGKVFVTFSQPKEKR
ncbi:xin actin-binding repeat-containing protein 1-like [Hippocampus comes]|uniref:xin actin-binding repeat-containing protein 1-like n=1 Tax=Hippocampus comes TaxID=109280 RepID=UPI00094E8357|nr:PREDICTED: xin actin-binding repeat-containing protein 1-like [Hippocampus comes]